LNIPTQAKTGLNGHRSITSDVAILNTVRREVILINA